MYNFWGKSGNIFNFWIINGKHHTDLEVFLSSCFCCNQGCEQHRRWRRGGKIVTNGVCFC